jgi:hypothetical protein
VFNDSEQAAIKPYQNQDQAINHLFFSILDQAMLDELVRVFWEATVPVLGEIINKQQE